MTLLVQTERILDNFRLLQKQAGRTPLIPLLEANACGLGDAAVAQLLVGEGVRTLAVSRLEEHTGGLPAGRSGAGRRSGARGGYPADDPLCQ